MLRLSCKLAVALLGATMMAAPAARAEPIVAGTTFFSSTAIQDITLLANSAFNSTDQDLTFEIHGVGGLWFNRETQVGNTITFSSATGLYSGSDPHLGTFTFGSIPPLQPSGFNGMITDVVQDPSDPGYSTGQPSSLVSGNLTFGGASFGLAILGGPSVYTDPLVPFSFTATLDGLPPSLGTVLVNSGADRLNILFNGEVVGYSSNRRIILTAPVPEPSSLILCGASIALLGGLSWTRRRPG